MATDGSLAAFFDSYEFPEEVRVELMATRPVVHRYPESAR